MSEFYLCLRCIQAHAHDSKRGIAHKQYTHPIPDAWLHVSPPSNERLRRAWYEEHRDAIERTIAERRR